MECLDITKQYYAAWLGVDTALFDQKGVFTVFHPMRDERQMGYSRPFHLYTFVYGEKTIISHGVCLQPKIGQIEAVFRQEDNLERVKIALENVLGTQPGHAFKYYFEALSEGIDISQARQLTRADYEDYLWFRQQLYPDSDQESWLEDFFYGCVDRGFIFGSYTDGRLTSATETPDTPFLSEQIVEIGIATLPEYQRKGQAKVVCGALAQHLLKMGKAPIWSCSHDNVASQRLAEVVGFRKMADLITVTLPN